jgi:hypothetical protein
VAPNDDKTTQLSRRVRNIYAGANYSQLPENERLAVAHKELLALADVNLGPNYNPSKLLEVARLQRHLKERQRELASQLKSGKLPPTEFSVALRRLLTQVANQCEEILGAEDYVKLFGIPAKDAADLIAPPTFNPQ